MDFARRTREILSFCERNEAADDPAGAAASAWQLSGSGEGAGDTSEFPAAVDEKFERESIDEGWATPVKSSVVDSRTMELGRRFASQDFGEAT